jgi:glioma pathogenesis-related protein 2
MNPLRVAILALTGLTATTLTTVGVVGTSLSAKSQVTSQKPPIPLVAQATNLTTFRQEALDTHNQLRAKHGAPPMKLSNALNQKAQRWAQNLARLGKLQHSGPGENLYWSTADASGNAVVQNWYDEVKDYNYNKPVFSMNTGHFTQVVWKGSGELGCGKAKGTKGYYVVCSYNPPGNMQGAFGANVGRPK